MANVGTSISYNLSNLTRLTGRDAPRHYWPYMVLLLVLNFLVGLAITIPMIAQTVTTAMEAVGQNANGMGPNPEQLEAQMMQMAMANVSAMLPYTALLALVTLGLSLAATVRRLHDRDWSGWWALLLVAAKGLGLATSVWSASLAADGFAAMQSQMGTLQILGWLPWIAYIVLLIQLVQGGTVGDNRYGPEPDPSW